MRSKLQMQKWKSRIAIVCTAALVLSGITIPTDTKAEEDKVLASQVEAAGTTEAASNGTRDGTTEALASEGEETQAGEYACSFEIHTHTDSCYDADHKVICGYADYAVHTHDDKCYDSTGKLVCKLKEVKEHVHDDSCYKIVEIPAVAQAETAEPEETQQGHVHTEECYQTEQILTCGQEETPGHTHTEECYEVSSEESSEESAEEASKQLICGQEETPGHTHDENCYTTETKLICGLEEGTQTVTEPVEEAEPEITKELICTKPEVQLHTHSASCYDASGNLICGKLEVLRHQHTQDCFTAAQEEPEAQEETQEIDQAKIDNLCDAILEAMQEDEDLQMDLYAATEDLEKQQSLAERFGVEPADILTLFEQIQNVTDAISDAMDEADDGGQELMEQLQNAVSDPELLQELAERFQTTSSVLLLTASMALGIQPYATANTGSYVGVRGDKLYPLSGRAPEYALGVISYEDYTAEGATEETRAQKTQIAYCYNVNNKFPGNVLDGRYQVDYDTEYMDNAFCLYEIVSNATASDFTSMASGSKLSGEALRNKILNVALKGYPHNYLGLFYGQGGMTEEQFRLITQYAIWYYTDSWMPALVSTDDGGRFSNEELALYYALINDKDSNLSGYSTYCTAAKAAYKAENEITDSAVLNQYSFINLYGSKSDENAYSGDTRTYQNLLVVGYEYQAIHPYVPTPEPTPSAYKLTISKKVNGGEDDTTFHFKVRIYKEGGRDTGYYDFYWKNGDTGAFTVYAGETYEVIEVATEGYATSATSSLGDAGAKDTNGDYKITGTIGGADANISVDFENTKSSYSLTVVKQVEGGADDSVFTYTINFYSNGGTKFVTSSTLEIEAGTGKTIPYIPAGYTYEIIEDAADGYTASATSSRGDTGAKNADGTYTITGSNGGTDSAVTVNFVNTKDVPDTYNLTFSKEVKVTEDTLDTDKEFAFTVKLADGSKKTNSNGENTDITAFESLTGTYHVTYGTLSGLTGIAAPSTTGEDITFTDGQATIKLKHGQTATIEGLPANYMFNIAEDSNSFKGYTPSIVAGGKTLEGYSSISYPALNEDINVAFTNTKIERKSSLTLSKQVAIDSGVTNASIDPNEEFTFTVKLVDGLNKTGTGADNDINSYAPLTGTYNLTYSKIDSSDTTVAAVPSAKTLTLDENGEGTITLKHGQQVKIEGLPYYYGYMITEKVDTTKYRPDITVDTKNFGGHSGYGVIGVGADTHIDFTNFKLRPDSYEVTLSKQVEIKEGLTNASVDPNEEFTFTVKLVDGSNKTGSDANSIDSYAPLTGSYTLTYSKIDPSDTNVAAVPSDSTLTLNNGVGTITLKHGQKVTIKGLPYRYGYMVTENVDTSKYTPSIKVDGADKGNLSGYGSINLAANSTMDFTNIKIKQDSYNLTLGKTVQTTKTAVDTSKTFTFTVNLYKLNSSKTYEALAGPFDVTYGKSDANAEDVPTTEQLPFTNGVQEITLKHGQTITIKGLPENYKFTITESSTGLQEYTPTVKVNGEQQKNTQGTDTIHSLTYSYIGEDLNVEFVNIKNETTHTLTLSKEVKTAKAAINTDEDFTFKIKLYNSDAEVLKQKFNATYGTISDITDAKTPEQTTTELDFSSGEATVTLKHGQTITIEGLPYIYGYTITEDVDGYTPTVKINGEAKKNQEGTDTIYSYTYYGSDKDMTVAYTNTKIERSLSLEKTVEGKFADKDQEFKFDLELTTGSTPISGTFQVTGGTVEGTEATAPSYPNGITFDADGKATVYLKHGQKIKIEGLPYNYVCKITEDSAVAKGYEIQSKSQTTASSGTSNYTSGATMTVGYGDASVSYINTKEDIVPTGRHLNVMPYVLAIGIWAGFVALLLMHRRRQR